MRDVVGRSEALIQWYDRSVRPFLQRQGDERVAELERDRDGLRAASQSFSSELAVCFLGSAGVGKSTLINALVGKQSTIVPSGGVGPLTAQALTVRYGEQPRFVVRYHPIARLLNLIRALEWGNRSELRGAAGAGLGPTNLFSPESQDAPPSGGGQPIEPSKGDGDDDEVAAAPASREEYRKTAQLIVTGNQDHSTDLPYLIDCLYEVAGKPRVWGTSLKAEDAARVERVKAVLARDRDADREVRGALGDRAFLDEVRDHACGSLAPLIDTLTIYWDCELLRDGVVLVDLPGVGVAGDRHEAVTRSWIRTRAQAIVLVVDHRGITQPVAELLRKSEFLNRLLYSGDEPEGDPVLMVAVVKIDDIAESRWRDDKTKKRRLYFQDVCSETHGLIQSQVQSQLEAVWSNGDRASEGQQQVIDNILGTLQVHPLSAIQYRKSLDDDDEDRAFVATPEESNVPQLAESLGSLARERREVQVKRLQDKADLFQDRVTSILRVIQAQWQEQTRAAEEADRLRSDLSDFLQAPRKELHVRQGNYRQFLKKTVPQRITDLVAGASLKAQVEINKYLNRLGSAHWATLRASVRHGGRYSGATDVQLPREFALRFEEPIAEAWTKQILKDIRRETKEYASDCVRLVAAVVQWAKEQGARVQPALVEAQYDTVKADAKKLESVGREMVAELREEAKNQLIDAIEGPIREGCGAFVRRNADVGRGVKDRILRLYAELAAEVTQAAAKPAAQILKRLFTEVEQEITGTMEQHQDPLTAAMEAIVSSQENYLKRSDAQRRKGILADLDAILADKSLGNEPATVTTEQPVGAAS